MKTWLILLSVLILTFGAFADDRLSSRRWTYKGLPYDAHFVTVENGLACLVLEKGGKYTAALKDLSAEDQWYCYFAVQAKKYFHAPADFKVVKVLEGMMSARNPATGEDIFFVGNFNQIKEGSSYRSAAYWIGSTTDPDTHKTTLCFTTTFDEAMERWMVRHRANVAGRNPADDFFGAIPSVNPLMEGVSLSNESHVTDLPAALTSAPAVEKRSYKKGGIKFISPTGDMVQLNNNRLFRITLYDEFNVVKNWKVGQEIMVTREQGNPHLIDLVNRETGTSVQLVTELFADGK